MDKGKGYANNGDDDDDNNDNSVGYLPKTNKSDSRGVVMGNQSNSQGKKLYANKYTIQLYSLYNRQQKLV